MYASRALLVQWENACLTNRRRRIVTVAGYRVVIQVAEEAACEAVADGFESRTTLAGVEQVVRSAGRNPVASAWWFDSTLQYFAPARGSGAFLPKESYAVRLCAGTRRMSSLVLEAGCNPVGARFESGMRLRLASGFLACGPLNRSAGFDSLRADSPALGCT